MIGDRSSRVDMTPFDSLPRSLTELLVENAERGGSRNIRLPPRPRGVGETAPQKVNLPTVLRRSAAIRESSSTAVRVCPSACVVDSAAVETPVMLSAI